MFYGQIPLQKVSRPQAIVMQQDEYISADFNDSVNAASLIKNYNEWRFQLVVTGF